VDYLAGFLQELFPDMMCKSKAVYTWVARVENKTLAMAALIKYIAFM